MVSGAQAIVQRRKKERWERYIGRTLNHIEKDEKLKKKVDEEELVYWERLKKLIEETPEDDLLFDVGKEELGPIIRTSYGLSYGTKEHRKTRILTEIESIIYDLKQKEKSELEEERKEKKLKGQLVKKKWWPF